MDFNESIIKPDATLAELDKLVKTKSDEVKKKIALHPNTSPNTLVELFPDYPEQVLNNPTLDLILLENPDFLEQLCKPDACVYPLAKLPTFFVEWAVNHPQPSIRSLAANNYYIPIDYLEKLAHDVDHEVRVCVASNVCISNRNFEWLYGESAIDRTVNLYPDAALEILCQLAQDKHFNVRYVVANNTGTPSHIIEQLSFDPHPSVRNAVALNHKASEKVLRRLFNEEDASFVENIATNRNIPHDLMEICAASKKKIRCFIADNPSATKDILIKLASDSDALVRHKVANNSNTPPEIIEQLARKRIEP